MKNSDWFLNVVKVMQLPLENMQRHTESIKFGLFLKISISGMSSLGELIF